jgi:hypothetical protein
MHKTILAAVAAAALFAPAVAQQINPHGQTGQDPQAQRSAPPLAQAARIAPELLNAHQVRDIQKALETRGAQSMRQDGQWGPDIEMAIMNFQKAENLITQTGELDPLTLMALGLNPMSFGLSGNSETTGQAPQDGASPQEQLILQEQRPQQEQPARELPAHEGR